MAVAPRHARRLWPAAAPAFVGLVVLALAAINGLRSLAGPRSWLGPPDLYLKDVLQDYVAAMALRRGDDPLAWVHALVARYLGPVPADVFHHASPHPPTLALLLVPLTW